MIKPSIIFFENKAFESIGTAYKEQLDIFSQKAQKILSGENLDPSAELALIVHFMPKALGNIKPFGTKNLSPKADGDISMIRMRLGNIIKETIQNTKQYFDDSGLFFGIGANFYLTLNCKEKILEDIKTTESKQGANQSKAAENPIAIKQQLQNKDASSSSFRLEPPLFTMDKIELPKKTRNALLETITLIKKQPLIYEEWGFSEIDSVPKTIVNFYGPPGTGKTMSAHIIASELGKQIINANYSDIESKFVGDAPKNLVSVFDLAQKNDAVLFFDEADSFLGKRIQNVSHSSDQALNSLRSELLKLLESRPVIVIFATNLLGNYDKAFHSRILHSVGFELPNTKQRKALILKHIPSKLYEKGVEKLNEKQLDELSELSSGFSGREIKKRCAKCFDKGF
ncbi:MULTISPECIES: ATP-binding protein [unclassified Helicobacter]|uniref:ATP-binding protein n=1 Tax=unclassified Helicobacter TaxID=2593540 RepID=UPI000AE8C31C|nr:MULTISPECIES: ATP-binding protein [unclassified Helicobacter]